jgi:hypothetical protein
MINVTRTQRELRRFISRHRARFDRLASSEAQILEISALAVAATHYEKNGYSVAPENLKRGSFRVKVKSGYRENFSWFGVAREEAFEVHANLGVQSAYMSDTGIYVVDVAVTHGGSVANKGPGKRDEWIANRDLVTFLEAKKLVAFPMLLAQFVGIVHEIKPGFLKGRRPHGFVARAHFDPALVTVGPVARTAGAIRDGFAARGFRIQVVTNFDNRISWLSRHDDSRSPLSM